MFNFVQFEFNLIEMLLFNLALDLTENPAVTQFPKRGVKTGVLMIPMPDLFHLQWSEDRQSRNRRQGIQRFVHATRIQNTETRKESDVNLVFEVLERSSSLSEIVKAGII